MFSTRSTFHEDSAMREARVGLNKTEREYGEELQKEAVARGVRADKIDILVGQFLDRGEPYEPVRECVSMWINGFPAPRKDWPDVIADLSRYMSAEWIDHFKRKRASDPVTFDLEPPEFWFDYMPRFPIQNSETEFSYDAFPKFGQVPAAWEPVIDRGGDIELDDRINRERFSILRLKGKVLIPKPDLLRLWREQQGRFLASAPKPREYWFHATADQWGPVILEDGISLNAQRTSGDFGGLGINREGIKSFYIGNSIERAYDWAKMATQDGTPGNILIFELPPVANYAAWAELGDGQAFKDAGQDWQEYILYSRCFKFFHNPNLWNSQTLDRVQWKKAYLKDHRFDDLDKADWVRGPLCSNPQHIVPWTDEKADVLPAFVQVACRRRSIDYLMHHLVGVIDFTPSRSPQEPSGIPADKYQPMEARPGYREFYRGQGAVSYTAKPLELPHYEHRRAMLEMSARGYW